MLAIKKIICKQIHGKNVGKRWNYKNEHDILKFPVNFHNNEVEAIIDTEASM